MVKSMKSYLEDFENYQKNLLCIKDVMDRVLNCMKGHGASFRPEITDGKGAFSQEKLCGLVGELISLWVEKVQDGTFTDPSTGESLSEPYIRDRRELYGCYLYLVMRCSLGRGDYALVCGGDMKERTDFAFLLEQAKRLWKDWCVTLDSEGNKKNEPFWGYDGHFGLHLYQVLSNPGFGFDNPLTYEVDKPVNRPASLTDEGNVHRDFFKKIYCGRVPAPWMKKSDDTVQTDEDGDMEDSLEEEEDFDSYDAEDEYDDPENDYEEWFDEAYEDEWMFSEEYARARYEEGEEWAQKQTDLEYLTLYFTHRGEYLEACRKFTNLFEQAKPEVLRRFCEDLEEIVNLFLVKRGIPPLLDTDKVLDVYSGIYDGPCQQAERYARGAQWKNQ